LEFFVKHRRSAGHAIIEWVLCVPVLLALVSFLFGFLFLALQQIQLEDLCARTVDKIAHSDNADVQALEQEAILFIRTHSAVTPAVRLDWHLVEEKTPPGPAFRPPIDILGLELVRAPSHFSGVRLRAYARAARIR
jgi:hypothetical protein